MPQINIERVAQKDIAVIGMAGRLPLAANLNEFWQNLVQGRDCIADFPASRVADIVRYLDFRGTGYTPDELRFKKKGYLPGVDRFDYKFFRYSRKEASLMNPAQRIFLETAYHAIEHAGYSCKGLAGTNVGIFLGYTGGASNYLDLVCEVEPEFAGMAYPANLASIIASRIAYLFDLRGPALLIDTACSSSMTAFNLACQSLRDGRCAMAIAGGINLSWAPFEEKGSGIGILSPNSRVRAFDEAADGTVGGEGCVAILLKPLSRALRENDNVLSVVKGFASNQDGSSIGITAPNPQAQAEVIGRAWKDASIDPATISYIETHGTGTSLGDPIEIEGITKAFRKVTAKKQFCAIGAVKTNIGHLSSAAGAAGIAKAVLCLKNRKLPPTINFERPNSRIAFEHSPVYVNTRLSDWTAVPGEPRRCGVSSFGMSGTNGHVVLEEAPAPPVRTATGHPSYLFAVSAKSQAALERLIDDYIGFLEEMTAPAEGMTALAIEDICYTATVGRDHHQIRLVFRIGSTVELREKLIRSRAARSAAAGNAAIHPATGDLQMLVAGIYQRLGEHSSAPENYERVLEEIARLYMMGAEFRWEELFSGRNPRRIELPLYPFEQPVCWVTYPEPAVLPATNKTHLHMTDSNIQDIINMQLQVMERQLEAMGAVYGAGPANEYPAACPEELPALNGKPAGATGANKQPNALPDELTDTQRSYLERFIAAFNRKTARSKELMQARRPYYANNRHVAGYHKLYKELMYPVLADAAAGSHITDVDGNRYVDFCMGFGVYLLGYSHPAISSAIKLQLDKGVYLGPMTGLAGEVAALIAEMTGTDRVAFYNSGTEAVMVALRLARAATSRTKIVLFSGSYHGTYDGVLAQPDRFSKGYKAAPKSTGIPQSILDEIVLLDYGSPESLEIIRRQADELACVLVEPVQSRRPEFQPREYLVSLRALTEELKIPLIFDEMITGFRVHPGGAQAWFGIQADLVTYGKIAGGGMPIGIVAGKAEYMHGVDGGGTWSYGDDSQPKFDHRKTFVAGTFCHHPVTMAAAKAALLHLKEAGPVLQTTLNARTREMAETLNAWFESEAFDVRIVHFGSLFQIRTPYDLSLIVYHFIDQGIYAWEGMTFFLSTAHTEEDIAFLIEVFKNTLQTLRGQGFIPGREAPDGAFVAEPADGTKLAEPAEPLKPAESLKPAEPVATIPLTDEQRRLWFMASADERASAAFNSTRVVPVSGKLDKAAFSRAVDRLLERHEILRTIAIDGDQLQLGTAVSAPVRFLRLDKGRPEATDEFIRKEKARPFPFSMGPFFRITVLEGEETFLFVLVIHHIIADGWSVNVILSEMAALYTALGAGGEASLAPPVSFSSYLRWMDEHYRGEENADGRAYWTSLLEGGLPSLELPHLAGATVGDVHAGNTVVLKLREATTTSLAAYARKEGCTVFMVFLALFQVFLSKLTGRRSQLTGIPSAGQLNMEAESLVGCCIQLLPFYTETDAQSSFSEFLHVVKNRWLETYRYRNFPYTRLAQEDNYMVPELDIVFNMDAPASVAQGGAGDERGNLYKKSGELNKYALFLNVIKIGAGYKLSFQYSTALFREEWMEAWVKEFEGLTETVLTNRSVKIGELDWPGGQGPEEWRVAAKAAVTASEADLPGAAGSITKSGADLPGAEGSITKSGAVLPAAAGPVSGVEGKLLAIFRAILKTNDIGINDDFFELGGNSLKALQILSRIQRELNVRLPLRQLFTHRTVSALADAVGRTGPEVITGITKAPVQEWYPVSHAQKRIWIIDQAREGQTDYVISKVMLLEGRFEPDHLGRAVEKLVERHESLRTNFIVVDGEPMQKINDPDPDRPIHTFVDISGEENPMAVLDGLIEKATANAFDLAADPLFRVRIIKAGDQKYALLLFVHHIITDGWSMEVIMNELLLFYNAYVHEQPVQLPPLPLQYKDFAVWQNELIADRGTDAHKQYWLDQLKGFQTLDLVPDRPRPSIKTSNGDRVDFDLGEDASDRLFAIGKRYGTSTFTTLLAFTNLLLYKYTGIPDILLGSTIVGRDRSELEDQVGFYANTVVFRQVFAENDSFAQLLLATREVVLNAYEHQQYPFDLIVRDLDIRRDSSRSPLFDVMIELDDIGLEPAQDVVLEDLRVAFPERGLPASKFDVTFRFNAGDTIFGCIEFNTDLFDRSTIAAMSGYFQQLIGTVDANMELPVSRIDYLAAEEKAQLLARAAQPFVIPAAGESILTAFAKAVAAHPTDTSVVCGSTRVSYSDLDRKSDALARYLKERYRIGPNDRIGLLANRSERVVVALLGILKADAAFVPVDPELPLDRIGYILRDANVSLLLTDSEFLLLLSEFPDTPLFVLDIELNTIAEEAADVAETASGDDLGYIIYTSGSTGRPKGVAVERRSLANYIHWANAYYFGDKPARTFAFFTSLAFDLTLTSLFSTLLRGDTLVVFERGDIHELLQEIFSPGSGIDVVKMTPSHIDLVGLLELRATSVSQVIAGGEALTERQVSLLRALNQDIRVYNEYGPTEVTVGCVVKDVTADAGEITIGRPGSGASVYILDRNLHLVGPGVAGEIHIGGEGVARGYLNAPEYTHQKFIANPFGDGRVYKSGDRGRWLSNGEIAYLGRADGQVKINGHRVELAEISETLRQYNGIDQAAAAVIADGNGNSLLAACYTGEGPVDVRQLLFWLKERLPLYMVPARIVRLEALPLTVNGKIDAKRLADQLAMEDAAEEAMAEPVNETERRLAAVWERLFGIPRVGVHDNFFQLGGHSLKATQMILELFKEFKIRLSLDEIFAHPTIRELSLLLQPEEMEQAPEVLPLPDGVEYAE